jgi:hypothetical protein
MWSKPFVGLFVGRGSLVGEDGHGGTVILLHQAGVMMPPPTLMNRQGR